MSAAPPLKGRSLPWLRTRQRPHYSGRARGLLRGPMGERVELEFEPDVREGGGSGVHYRRFLSSHNHVPEVSAASIVVFALLNNRATILASHGHALRQRERQRSRADRRRVAVPWRATLLVSTLRTEGSRYVLLGISPKIFSIIHLDKKLRDEPSLVDHLYFELYDTELHELRQGRDRPQGRYRTPPGLSTSAWITSSRLTPSPRPAAQPSFRRWRSATSRLVKAKLRVRPGHSAPSSTSRLSASLSFNDRRSAASARVKAKPSDRLATAAPFVCLDGGSMLDDTSAWNPSKTQAPILRTLLHHHLQGCKPLSGAQEARRPFPRGYRGLSPLEVQQVV